MPLKLYRPDLGRQVNQEVGAASPGLDPAALLLLNILIELQVHTQYLAATCAGTVNEDPDAMRLNIARGDYPLNAF